MFATLCFNACVLKWRARERERAMCCESALRDQFCVMRVLNCCAGCIIKLRCSCLLFWDFVVVVLAFFAVSIAHASFKLFCLQCWSWLVFVSHALVLRLGRVIALFTLHLSVERTRDF